MKTFICCLFVIGVVSADFGNGFQHCEYINQSESFDQLINYPDRQVSVNSLDGTPSEIRAKRVFRTSMPMRLPSNDYTFVNPKRNARIRIENRDPQLQNMYSLLSF